MSKIHEALPVFASDKKNGAYAEKDSRKREQSIAGVLIYRNTGKNNKHLCKQDACRFYDLIPVFFYELMVSQLYQILYSDVHKYHCPCYVVCV